MQMEQTLHMQVKGQSNIWPASWENYHCTGIFSPQITWIYPLQPFRDYTRLYWGQVPQVVVRYKCQVL